MISAIAVTAAILIGAVPFVLVGHTEEGREMTAILNQDGSWTIDGDITEFLGKFGDSEVECIADLLVRTPPRSNPAADNTAAMSVKRMNEVMCADPILRQCLQRCKLQISGSP